MHFKWPHLLKSGSQLALDDYGNFVQSGDAIHTHRNGDVSSFINSDDPLIALLQVQLQPANAYNLTISLLILRQKRPTIRNLLVNLCRGTIY